jgi:hypothetical protein
MGSSLNDKLAIVAADFNGSMMALHEDFSGVCASREAQILVSEREPLLVTWISLMHDGDSRKCYF